VELVDTSATNYKMNAVFVMFIEILSMQTAITGTLNGDLDRHCFSTFSK